MCSIIGTSDGDILRARCAKDGALQTIAVRLAEVDAPEKAQPFGARSKQNLSALCFHRSAEVRPVSMDRYWRTVAHVNCNGHDAARRKFDERAWPRYLRDAQQVAPWDGDDGAQERRSCGVSVCRSSSDRSVHRDTQVRG
jgi:hypothetical protein